MIIFNSKKNNLIFKKNISNIFPIIFVIFSCMSCSKSEISSVSGQNFYNGDIYVPADSVLKLYRLKPTGYEFETELLPSGTNSIVVPKNILRNDFEDRTKTNVAHPVDFFMKVYSKNSQLPDKYFEAPILGSNIKPSNVSTAISWLLRWSFSGEILNFKYNDFNQFQSEVEIKCISCRDKSNSEVVDYILKNSELLNSLKSKIESSNPNILMNQFNYFPPSSDYVFSIPQITRENKALIEIEENKVINGSVIYIDPQNSKNLISPISWTRDFNLVTYNHSEMSFVYQTTFIDAGFHLIKPLFDTISPSFQIEATVTNKNRIPLCDTSTPFTFKVNRQGTIDLSTICNDLDPEDSILRYNIISAPPGSSLSSDGIFRWIVKKSHYDQNENWTMTFGVTDPKFGYSEYTININLVPDRFPIITFNGPNSNLVEGVESSFTISGVDPDNDDIILQAQSITILQNGLPTGSSDLSGLVRTGSNGSYSWTFTFTPSYLQAIGGDSTVVIKFLTKYNPLSSELDSTVELSSLNVTFNLTNVDDPPIWNIHPIDFTATEGSVTTITFTKDVVDPNPNSSTLRYRLETPTNPECDWGSNFIITELATEIQLDVTPSFNSLRECYFQLIAEDTTGLSTRSNNFIVTVVDTNNPVFVSGSAPVMINGFERTLLQLEIPNMFFDWDEFLGDRDEQFTWTCFLDQDLDGNYTDDCFQPGSPFRPALSRFNLTGSWMPSATSAGSYFVRLSVTDKGGAMATHDFVVNIVDTPAPLDLDILDNNGLSSSYITVNENTISDVTLRVMSATLDPIDNYNFTVQAVTCTPLQGAGSCPNALLTPGGNFSGTGSTDFVMTLAPSYTDGNHTFPATSRSYSYTFTAYKTDQPTITTEISVLVQVNNNNRVPSSVTAAGCTNCTLVDNPADPIMISINAGTDSKVGPNWSKTYTTTFAVNDLDTNDSKSVALSPASAVLGTFSGYTWSFKLPTCVNPSPTSSVVRTIIVRGSDGRGGTYDRNVQLNIQKASAGTSCLVP